jgi:hypothetical protein
VDLPKTHYAATVVKQPHTIVSVGCQNERSPVVGSPGATGVRAVELCSMPGHSLADFEDDSGLTLAYSGPAGAQNRKDLHKTDRADRPSLVRFRAIVESSPVWTLTEAESC